MRAACCRRMRNSPRVGIGKASFTTVAQSYLAGGHVRIGLEDAVYLSRGRFATSNAEMVGKARRIVEDRRHDRDDR